MFFSCCHFTKIFLRLIILNKLKHILFITFFTALHFLGYAQVDSAALGTDSINNTDSILIAPVSISKDSVGEKTIDTSLNKFLNNPFIKEEAPIYLIINKRKRVSKDELFYLATGLLFFLAFLRLTFSKYFSNIFRLFFQPTFRQKQTREQLLQNNFPALMFNLLFIFSAATYIALVVDYFHAIEQSLWWLFIYSAALLFLLYIGKLLFLRLSGWLFNVKEATSTYIFIVYLVNKISGIILIPFIIIIGFSNAPVVSIAVTFSLLIIALLFSYRYLVSYAPVRSEIKVSAVHFFFYLCAFEIIPLLLIYKVLVIYMARSV
jgi:hypothetical protein